MPKTQNRGRSQTNGWDVLRDVVNQGFNSGYALLILVGTIFLGTLGTVAFRLDSKDLEDLIGAALGSWATGLGWLLFLLGSTIYMWVIRWMKGHYEAEIDRQRQIIDRLLPLDDKDQFKLK
jgi:protein-S-isoprenylcysteine O-methyltransferase Ste14